MEFLQNWYSHQINIILPRWRRVPRKVLTIEQAQLQQRRQGSDDHKHEKATAPAHQAHRRAQRYAGGHRNARHGVIICIEVMEHRRLLNLVVHHAAGEAVVDPIAC